MGPHGLCICDSMDYTARILQARILDWVDFPFSRDSSNPGIKPRSPTLQADSLPTEPRGKPTNHVVWLKKQTKKDLGNTFGEIPQEERQQGKGQVE